jgi:hypothetical protein
MTKHALTFLFILLALKGWSQTGGIRGTTVSDKGEPLPFVGIFVKNIKAGTSSNLEAKFELKLAPGEYQLVIQSLGYQTEQKTVNVSNEWVDMNFILTAVTYTLSEVKIGLKDENPAYAIMRKAISMAKFYQFQIEEYEAKTYVKGVAKINHIPWVFRKMDEDHELDTSKIYLIESRSEISYKRPNTYTEKVISVRSNMDDKFPSPMEYIKGSFYSPDMYGAVSPLSPKAFSYYSFSLEGSFFEGKNQVNKIKVTPRIRRDGVFEGSIYIVENIWCIHSVHLSTVHEGITTIITQLYSEVQDKVWMPLTQSFVLYGSVLGLGFNGKYQATVNNYKIKINESIKVPDQIIDEKTEKEELVNATRIKSKSEADVEKLLQGDKKLTVRDMRKLMKMYEKDENKKTAEPEVVSNETMVVDSMAYKRDSLYWERERTIPLTETEIKSYKIKDSLAVVEKEKAAADSTKTAKKKKGKSFNPGIILVGYTFKIDSTSSLKWVSPVADLSYNTVEEYAFASSLIYNKRFVKQRELILSPVLRYSTGRDLFRAKGSATYKYGEDEASGSIKVEGGRYLYQLNPANPISYNLNTIATLTFESNFMKLYEKKYGSLSFSQKISDRIFFNVTGEYAKRYMLNNTEHAKPFINWKGKEFTSNDPYNAEVPSTAFITHQSIITQFSLSYLFWKKYIVSNGVKKTIGDPAPKIKVNYRKGWKNASFSNVDFDFVEARYIQELKLGGRGLLNFGLGGGGFLNDKSLFFMDDKHFMGNRTFIQQDILGYRMLDYYLYSTHKYFAEGMLHFRTQKLLVTQFIVPRMMGLKENIFLNYLYTPSSKNYVEIGYGLDKIFRFIRVEAVCSFSDLRYQSVGIRIGLAPGLISVK